MNEIPLIEENFDLERFMFIQIRVKRFCSKTTSTLKIRLLITVTY